MTGTGEQMKLEFAYFGECWNFFKRHFIVDNTPEYWDKVFEEASAINQKYKQCLCKDVLLSIVEELNRKSKQLEEVTA